MPKYFFMIKTTSGFTLIELMIIIGIISVVALVIVGIIWGFDRLFDWGDYFFDKLFGWFGDGKLKKMEFAPVILDDANLLSKQAKDALTTFHYPKGFIFIIRTITSLPEKYVGLEADELFDSDIERCSEPKVCKRRGVYVILSETPSLIQVRTGVKFYFQAQWAGITVGSEYITKQQVLSATDRDAKILQMVEWLSATLPDAIDLPLYKRLLLYDILQVIGKELEDLSLPSEGFYSTYILKNFLKVRIFELNMLNTWWITFLLAAIVARFIQFLVSGLINGFCGLIKLPKQYTHVVEFLSTIAIDIGIAIPSLYSVIVLSGARIEDQIALKASGIPGINRLSFSADLFNIKSGLGIAVVIFFLYILELLRNKDTIIHV